VDLVLAEDTRHSKKLLRHFDIDTPLMAYHDHSSPAEVQAFVRRLEQGEDLAVISDAGTPLISDPGYRLVKQAHESGIRVVPIPGACAAIAALSASGLPTDRFRFEGFLSAKSAARRQTLQTLLAETSTVLFYESSHRIEECLSDISDVLGAERVCTLARELTKQFETIRTAAVGELVEFVAADENQKKGEFVIIIGGRASQQQDVPGEDAITILKVLMTEMPIAKAASLTAKITGLAKRQLYDYAVSHLGVAGEEHD
jgi:16S rRNA (cytidine1402-2'-O)-methyltransferase